MSIIHLYSQVISIENLFQAWNGFKKGKRNKKDVQFFERNLEDNLFKLYNQLLNKTYNHSNYTAFNIYDPKFRHIHKAMVKDRIVHHALVSIIEPLFDKTFVYDSYSCRKGKGLHRAMKRLFLFTRKVSKNYTDSCFILKLDIKKFFATVDHQILMGLLQRKIHDQDLRWLLSNIIESFHSEYGIGKGIPIGNLTSQIFANVYLDKLDKFVKEDLSIKYYIRYADDFAIPAKDSVLLDNLVLKINNFLQTELKLSLHKDKIIIRKLSQGIDFLGYIILPHYILPRTKTKRRIFKKLTQKVNSSKFEQSLQSYLGYLGHAESFKLKQQILKKFQNNI